MTSKQAHLMGADTPNESMVDKLKKQVRRLQQQNFKMRNCMNCKNWNTEEMFCSIDIPPFTETACKTYPTGPIKGRPAGNKWQMYV